MANPMAVPIKGDNQSGATPVVPLDYSLISKLPWNALSDVICCKMLNKLADMILHNQRYYIHYPDISVDIFCSCIKFINVCTKSSAFQPCFYFSILSILNKFFIQWFSLIQMLFIIPYTHVELLMAVCLLLTLTLLHDLYVEMYRGHQKEAGLDDKDL